jgi:hypothetical protein
MEKNSPENAPYQMWRNKMANIEKYKSPPGGDRLKVLALGDTPTIHIHFDKFVYFYDMPFTVHFKDENSNVFDCSGKGCKCCSALKESEEK